ncbi:MAG TPA: glycosyltransferase family 9 protein [Spirochaetota bacterium]|nr:glycosyltransferase family 9 protein [Spirochaetota bacterium]
MTIRDVLVQIYIFFITVRDFFLYRLLNPLATRTRPTRSAGKELLVVRCDAIGDYILFRDFLAEIKQSARFSGYRITLCGNALWRDVAERFDRAIIDDFIWLERKRFVKSARYRLGILNRVRARHYTCVINPAFSRDYFVDDEIVRYASANEKIGSSGDDANTFPLLKRLADRYYTSLIEATGDTMFEFNRNREFSQKLLGTPSAVDRPRLDVSAIKPPIELPGDFVVLFPSASIKYKRWDTANFAVIADHVAERYGLSIVVAGAPSDGTYAREIASRARCPFIDITGKTTIPELAAVLAKTRLLVSNDTVAVHLATAVGATSICISQGGRFGRFVTRSREVFPENYFIYPDEIMRDIDDPKLGEKYKYGSGLSINGIRPERVVALIDTILA